MNSAAAIFELAYVISQMMRDAGRKEVKVSIPSWIFEQGRMELMRNIPIKFTRSVDKLSGMVTYTIQPRWDFEAWRRKEEERRQQQRPKRVFDL